MKYTEKPDKISYSLGISIAGNLISSGVKTLNAELFCKAIRTIFSGQKPDISLDEVNDILQEYFEELEHTRGAEAKEAGEKFLKENKEKEGVVSLESGLQYKVLKAGNGSKPQATDTVICHYEGRLINNNIFDSSIQRGEPAEFPVNGVIAGWVEALQMMPKGSKWQLYIPSGLAYGSRGAGEAIGPNETLIFDVELLDIK